MSYTTRILLPSLLVSLLAACGGNDNNTSPTRIDGQENLPSLNAGGDQQAAERSNIELRATVQNQDQNSVVGYAWFPASEEIVFFGDAGRSDESVFNLQLPQVAANTPVEFVVQAQLSNGTVLEDRLGNAYSSRQQANGQRMRIHRFRWHHSNLPVAQRNAELSIRGNWLQFECAASQFS
jgi:hypothetical protein